MADTPEGIVKNEIKAVLTDFNIAYSMVTTNGYGDSGWPDFDVVLRGIYVTIEAKADCRSHMMRGIRTGGPTKLQQLRMAEIRDSGGVTLIVDAFMLTEFLSFIKEVMALPLTSITPAIVELVALKHNVLYRVDPRAKH